MAVGFSDSDNNDYHPPDVTFGIEFLGAIELLRPRSGLNAKPHMSHISTLVFDLIGSARWCWHSWDCDWNIVGELATQLPRLRRVVFGFISKSNLDRFAKRWGETALSKFLHAHSLHYAYIIGWQCMRWISVDPVSLLQEGVFLTCSGTDNGHKLI